MHFLPFEKKGKKRQHMKRRGKKSFSLTRKTNEPSRAEPSRDRYFFFSWLNNPSFWTTYLWWTEKVIAQLSSVSVVASLWCTTFISILWLILFPLHGPRFLQSSGAGHLFVCLVPVFGWNLQGWMVPCLGCVRGAAARTRAALTRDLVD